MCCSVVALSLPLQPAEGREAATTLQHVAASEWSVRADLKGRHFYRDGMMPALWRA